MRASKSRTLLDRKEDEIMMLEGGYREPLFVREGEAFTETMQESIPGLLRENHGVGIVGG